MIEITKDEERIKITFSYNPDYIAKIETIEGYRWYPKEKCWSVPYFEFETFLSVFGGEKLSLRHSFATHLLLRKLSCFNNEEF